MSTSPPIQSRPLSVIPAPVAGIHAPAWVRRGVLSTPPFLLHTRAPHPPPPPLSVIPVPRHGNPGSPHSPPLPRQRGVPGPPPFLLYTRNPHAITPLHPTTQPCYNNPTCHTPYIHATSQPTPRPLLSVIPVPRHGNPGSPHSPRSPGSVGSRALQASYQS